MSEAAVTSDYRDIVIDEVFPHARETLWKALTDGELIGRWLMPPIGFEPVVGKQFTFTTRPAGEWDGVIRCEVLEVVPHERFVYSWKGGHESNDGYGSRLETVVTWILTKVDQGTRLRLIHSGFVLPRNDTAYRNMSDGWTKVVERLDMLVGGQEVPPTRH